MSDEITCFHCGEVVDPDSDWRDWGNEEYMCESCAAVYDLLNEED